MYLNDSLKIEFHNGIAYDSAEIVFILKDGCLLKEKIT
jgi:hypothetical protein